MAKRISPKSGLPMTPFMLDEGIEIDICPLTKGIWLDLGELRVLTGLEADMPYFKEAMANARETIWPSPSAPCRLREVKFHPAHEVVIDYCPESGGIWLDRGELDKLKTIAAEIGDPKSRVLGLMRSMADSMRAVPSSAPPGSRR